MAIRGLHSVFPFWFFLSLLAAAGSSAAEPAATATRPEPGLYVLPPGASTPGGLVALRLLIADKVQQSGSLKLMIPFGNLKAHEHARFGGAKAAQRVGEGATAFYLYFDEHAGKMPSDPNDMQQAMSAAGFMFGHGLPPTAKGPEEFELVRLTVEGDARTVETGTVGGRKGASGASRDALPVKVEKLGERSYKLTPSAPLVPGEYGFLYTGQGPSATIWDFGIDPAR